MKIKKTEITAAVAKYRGNWLSFDSFAWFNKPQDAGNWAIVELYHRDSKLQDAHNGRCIKRKMQKFFAEDYYTELGPDACDWDASHWAVGFTKGVAVRVCRDDGSATPAFLALYRLLRRVDDDEVLSPAAYNRMLRTAILHNIEFACTCLCDSERPCRETLPRNWQQRLWRALSDVDPCWEDDLDSEGVPQPRTDTLLAALRNLGFIDKTA